MQQRDMALQLKAWDDSGKMSRGRKQNCPQTIIIMIRQKSFILLNAPTRDKTNKNLVLI